MRTTFVTKKGIVKRTPVSEYQNIRTNGIIALNLREDDELISVKVTDGTKIFYLVHQTVKLFDLKKRMLVLWDVQQVVFVV